MKRVNIVFPKEISLNNGFVKIDLENPIQNVISIDRVDYIPYYLNNSKPGNSGGNGCVLKLIRAQEFDEDEGYPTLPDLVIKICKFSIPRFKEELPKSKRFKVEIDALIDCNKHNLPNIVPIHHYGEAEIRWSDTTKNIRSNFRYYTMNYADSQLSKYLSKNNLTLIQRIDLGIEICQSLKQIWSRDFYHRDIKPDNILFIGDRWMISDLGLAEHRDLNQTFDGDAEWIGPRGWMSPESMNKFLTESKPWNKLHNCKINHQSDIYQIGKVLWYILQGNSPEGGVRRSDFLWKNEPLYQIIRTMLNNSKERRTKSIEEVIFGLKKIQKELLKSAKAEMLY